MKPSVDIAFCFFLRLMPSEQSISGCGTSHRPAGFIAALILPVQIHL
jgi:hypothetical protein